MSTRVLVVGISKWLKNKLIKATDQMFHKGGMDLIQGYGEKFYSLLAYRQYITVSDYMSLTREKLLVKKLRNFICLAQSRMRSRKSVTL